MTSFGCDMRFQSSLCYLCIIYRNQLHCTCPRRRKRLTYSYLHNCYNVTGTEYPNGMIRIGYPDYYLIFRSHVESQPKRMYAAVHQLMFPNILHRRGSYILIPSPCYIKTISPTIPPLFTPVLAPLPTSSHGTLRLHPFISGLNILSATTS